MNPCKTIEFHEILCSYLPTQGHFFENLHFMGFLIFLNEVRNSLLTLYAPTPKNGQTDSNNLSAVADELYECV